MSRIMSARRATFATVVLGTLTLAGSAFAQGAPPATGQDVPAETQAPPPPPAAAPAPSPAATAPPAPASTTPPAVARAASPSHPKPALVTANVNLRAGPGTDSAVIVTIPGGSTVRVMNCTGDWCAVAWNGRSGYAIARNLDTTRRRIARYPARRYDAGEPPVVYGPPVYYGPPVVYAPYYGPRYYYGPRWGWGRRYGW